MGLRYWIAGLACLAITAIAFADLPVDRMPLFELEKRFEGHALQLWGDDRFMFQQFPRAYYVTNFGVLMTAELSVAPGPGPSPFLPPLTRQTIFAHKKVVLERIPKLRALLKTELLDDVSMFPNLPDTERFGIAVTIYHISWEDTADVPTQIVVQGTKKALTAGHANPAMRDQAIEMRDMN